MLIYKITNKLNGKLYIGKTTQSLKARWSKHLSMAKNGHKYNRVTAIGAAIKKYGKENFLMEQIDSAETEDDLLLKEKYHADKLNTYVPRGYNIAECGQGGRRIGRCESEKTWIFLSPDNQIVKTNYLKDFCETNNLSYPCMISLFRDKNLYYKGWRNARRENKVYVLKDLRSGKDINVLDSRKDVIQKARVLKISPEGLGAFLISDKIEFSFLLKVKTFYTQIPDELSDIKLDKLFPIGRRETKESDVNVPMYTNYSLLNNKEMIVYNFRDILKFSKLNKLNADLVRSLFGLKDQKPFSHKEWSLPTLAIRRSILVSPSGIEFTVLHKEVFRFCENHKIGTFELVLDLIKNKRAEYHGWTLKRTWIPTRKEFKTIDLDF